MKQPLLIWECYQQAADWPHAPFLCLHRAESKEEAEKWLQKNGGGFLAANRNLEIIPPVNLQEVYGL